MRFSLCISNCRASSGDVGGAATTGLAALDSPPGLGAVAFAAGVTSELSFGGSEAAFGFGGGAVAMAVGAPSCCSTFVVGRAAGRRLNAAAAALCVGLGSVFVTGLAT